MARKRGRDRDVSWLSVTLATIQDASFKEAVEGLCSEIKSSIKLMQVGLSVKQRRRESACTRCSFRVDVLLCGCTAQDSFAQGFKDEIKQALMQVRPDAAGTAKGRHVRTTSPTMPYSAWDGEEYDKVLDDRLDWFRQVRAAEWFSGRPMICFSVQVWARQPMISSFAARHVHNGSQTGWCCQLRVAQVLNLLLTACADDAGEA